MMDLLAAVDALTLVEHEHVAQKSDDGRVRQRYFQCEAHQHGKGRWERRGPVHKSRIEASQYANLRGWRLRSDAVNGSRQMVYRIVEVTDDV